MYPETLAAAIDHIREGLQVIDREWRYLYVNRSVAAHGRRSPAELIGRRMYEVYPGIETTPLFAELRRCMEDRVPRRFENEFQHADGETGWFDLSIQPVAEGILILSSDITDRKHAEQALQAAKQELEHLNEGLEDRVRSRTAELLAANAELEAFAYSVSHDLRTPLRAINGFVGIIEEEHAELVDGQARELFARIRRNTMRMDELIKDLLTLAHVARIELRALPVDMRALVMEAWEECAPEDVRAAFSFTVTDLPAVDGDPRLLRQLWVNLLGNAVKFSLPAETKSIEVDARREEGEIIYRVRDRGIGFDPAHRDLLFGIFQRLHSGAEVEGTGIGLAIVDRVVKRHHGRAWAEGRPGEGATFHVALPRNAFSAGGGASS